MVIYAVDDEPILLRKLNQAIHEAAPDAQLYSFSRSSVLLDAMGNTAPMPDVAFLDIELPGMGGIELAKHIKLRFPKTWIVFVTGFSQYAIEAYEMHAKGYIMKPVTAQRIKIELETPCAVPLIKNSSALLRAQCFGTFEVFANDEPLKFERSKTKELFAYLIDRNGAAVNTGNLCAVLWEEQPDSEALHNYCRKLISDLTRTLASVGAEDVFIKSRNSFSVDVTKIDCDYYRFLNRSENSIHSVNTYSGEYMTQYSWAELTLANL